MVPWLIRVVTAARGFLAIHQQQGLVRQRMGQAGFGNRHGHSDNPDGYDYYHFNVYSDDIWAQLQRPPVPNTLDEYVARIADSLEEMVGAERDPNLLKRVVVIDGFPADIHEAEAGRSESRLYSATSPDRQFPDMVISLRCGREEALGRWLDRVPGDLWQLLPMFEWWFDNQYRVYTESTIPLLDSYRSEITISGNWRSGDVAE